DLNLRTTLTTTVDNNWARRFHSVQLRNRVEYNGAQFRAFANIDTSLSALNERDIFVVDSGFLPSDENFVTASVMPGVAYKFEGGEVRTSVALSRVNYLATDILGFDRSHDVVQPNLFFNAKVSGVELE